MSPWERRVARESRAMTRQEVVMKAVAGRLSWLQAADILGITPRHVRRLHWKFRTYGVKAIVDNRGGKQRRRRVPLEVLQELFRLRREKYRDFSVTHFHEHVTERHGMKVSYTYCKRVLQEAGLAEKAPGRGQYRRKRERRPLVGMLLHLDASTHAWLPELPMQDLMVMLDDADGRILYARFVEQEDTLSTLAVLSDVLERHGRFSELYTDRGSHFAPTANCRLGELRPEGQVQRVLRAVGIRHILARSPEARGRSERAFGTIQGRLPQELRLHGLTTYADANLYLGTTFVPDFNRRFTVVPAERGSAFVKVARLDLELLLSVHHERVVRPDSIVVFEKLLLQLPPSTHRQRFVRCPVLVHEFLSDTLGVSYQGRLIARFNRAGDLLPLRSPTVAAA
jgi:transposase